MLNKVKIRLKNFTIMIVIFGIYLAILEWLDSGTKCVIKNVTGIPCPSCGMTRSYLHVLEGDFYEAFYDHPLFFTVPIILIAAFIISTEKENIKLTKRLTIFLFIMIALFIIVYVIRMIMYFPDTNPLKFYDRGIIPSLYRKILSFFY